MVLHAYPLAGQPYTFQERYNICDTTGWKLVFYDEFSDTSVDKNKWHTYTTWAGIETDDWQDARPAGRLGLFVDTNVVVNNGTCKLRAFSLPAPTTWNCSSCLAPGAYSRSYTFGEITTYYGNGSSPHYQKSFGSGKFEARIRFPVYDYAHATFWTWPAGDVGSEIDIAEAYGNPFWTYYRVEHALHKWPWVRTGQDSVHRSRQFPGLTTWDKLTASHIHIQNWHVYACEWDQSHIRFFVDGKLVKTEGRYCKGTSPSDVEKNNIQACLIPETGQYSERPIFPGADNNPANLRLNTDIDRDAYPGGAGDSPLFLGQMEIDYVRVWQRQPSKDGHINICDRHITGDSVITGQQPHTYTISGAGAITTSPAWHWTVSDNLDIISFSTNTITVKSNSANGGQGWIKFNDDNLMCPLPEYNVVTLPGQQ